MSQDTDARALTVLSHMLHWSLGSLAFAAGPKNLTIDHGGHLIWSTGATEGGPVKIKRRLVPLALSNLQEMASIATELAEFAERVDLTSRLRAQCENDMRESAMGLLREVPAAKVELIVVVSQPIEDDPYDFGQEVTFASGSDRTTLLVADAEDLRTQFGEWLAKLGIAAPRLAA